MRMKLQVCRLDHHRRCAGSSRGFTLIELLVVIAIVAMLSAVTFASVASSREKARLAAARSFAASLDQTLSADVIGAWGFEGASTSGTPDTSGNGFAGSFSNSETTGLDTPWGSGNSLTLNGLNQCAIVSELGKTTLKYKGGPFTIAAWIKVDPSDADGGSIISKPWNGSGDYNYNLKRDASGYLVFLVGGATNYVLASNKTIPTGVWTHVAATIDASNNVTLYIDGKQVAQGVNTVANWTPTNGDANLSLVFGTLYPYGAWAGNTSYSLKGAIDDVRLLAATVKA